MGKRSIWGKRVSGAFSLAALLALLAAAPVMAQEMPGQDQPRNQWVDMEKGPGVAYWVDENGVRTDGPGMMQEEDRQPEAPAPQENGRLEEQPAEVNDQQEEAVPLEQEQPAEDSGRQEEAAQSAVDSEDPAAVQENVSQPDAGRVIDPDRPMVALTFDDGPFAPVGNQIMDCLAQYGGKATFYVVGDRCPSYRTEMQRMAAEGHEIGNHTYEHKYLNKLDAAQIQYQINKGSQIIQEVSGVTPATVRLPGGNKNATVLANVHAPIIMWSVDTLDWKTKNTQSTVDKVLGNVKDGDIILMHELYRQTGDAAVQMIPKLVERGYQLVTVSEMAKYRGGLENGKVYSAFRP